MINRNYSVIKLINATLLIIILVIMAGCADIPSDVKTINNINETELISETPVPESNFFGVYLKDNSVYYIHEPGRSIQLTDKFLKNGNTKELQSWVNNSVLISEDGSRVFYTADRYYAEDVILGDFYDLYYMDVKSGKGVLIDTDVFYYNISENGDKVAYVKKGGTIYWSDLKEKKEVAKGGTVFIMSSDGTKLMYAKGNDEMYMFDGSKEEHVEPGGVPIWISKDFKQMFYYKDEKAYHKEEGKTKKLLGNNYIEVLQAYDSHEVYFRGPSIGLCYFNGDSVLTFEESFREKVFSNPEKPILFFGGWNRGYYLVDQEKLKKVSAAEPRYFIQNSDNTVLYFLEAFDGYVNKIDIETRTQQTDYFGKIHTLFDVTDDEKFVYFKTSWHDLYVNNTKVSDDVSRVYPIETGFYYTTDEKIEFHDEERFVVKHSMETLHLYRYSDGKSTKIDDAVNVNYRHFISVNQLYYCKNYDVRDKSGHLYFYNGTESVLVDTGVMYIYEASKPNHGFIKQ